jgi:hypothetical protein
MITGLRLAMGEAGFARSAFKWSASPCAAKRTFSKVKSRAMRPRQPEVPNLMEVMGKEMGEV